MASPSWSRSRSSAARSAVPPPEWASGAPERETKAAPCSRNDRQALAMRYSVTGPNPSGRRRMTSRVQGLGDATQREAHLRQALVGGPQLRDGTDLREQPARHLGQASLPIGDPVLRGTVE